MKKKNISDGNMAPLAMNPPTAPLALLTGGDYWHPDFVGLDQRLSTDGWVAENRHDATMSDAQVIRQGLLIESLPPRDDALWRLVAPLAEKNNGKVFSRLLESFDLRLAAEDMPTADWAVQKSGMVISYVDDHSLLLYRSTAGGMAGLWPSIAKQPLIMAAGSAWQLVRIRGEKLWLEMLMALTPLDPRRLLAGEINFFSCWLLATSVSILVQEGELLLYIPRSHAMAGFQHMAALAAGKVAMTNGRPLLRVRIEQPRSNNKK